MSVRKRTWTNAKGEEQTAWVADYVDGKGARRLKTFKLKKQADAFAATASVEIREGVHVADSASATVKQAGVFWLASAEAAGLERTTIDSYRSHVDLHIVPFVGGLKLSALNIPAVRAFEDQLREAGRSAAMVRKVMVSLGSLLADAQERGLTGRNVVRDSPVFVQEGAYLVREIASLDDAVDFLTEWPEDLQDLVHLAALEACHAAHDGRLPMSSAREAFVGFAKRANILEDSVAVIPWMIGSEPGGGKMSS
jgi:hypothetical protein